MATTENFPTLSIVTVVFNGRCEIARTIDSVLAQDYPKIEYIVIDGASTDGTRAIIQQYKEKLDILVSETDDGIYDAMNKAISRASGEFILFMNSGDVFASPNAVASSMCFAKTGIDQILFGGWIRRKADNSMISCVPKIDMGLFNHQAVIYSRNIHSWHGNYLSVKGLTAADYLFFATLFYSTKVRC
jgi:glycosyltransferase involved in cell wall biosynthesis